MFHGCVPVNTKSRFVVVPLQIVDVPEMAAVGGVPTDTVAPPLTVPAQLVPFTEINVYTFVPAGLTVIEYGLAEMFVMLVVVVPSL